MSELRGRRLTDEERDWIESYPVECTEAVTRRRRGDVWQEPCDRIAVAARYDNANGGAYPVCAQHARGEMVTLADLLLLWDHWAGIDSKAAS